MICSDSIMLMVLERLKFVVFKLANVSPLYGGLGDHLEGPPLPLTPLLTLFTVLIGGGVSPTLTPL